MKTAKTYMVCSILAASIGLSQVAQAESSFTGNIAVTNNYIWRGVTQTNDQAAVQGGVDYDFGGGFAIGAWLSNVDFGNDTDNDTGTELDIYGSYGFDFGKGGALDVGFINYVYPSQDNIDFTEIFASYEISIFSVGAYFTIDKDGGGQEDDVYITASATFELGKDSSASVTIGDYDYDDPGTQDYTHYRLAYSKGDFTVALDKNDLDGSDNNTQADDVRISVLWSQSFDL